jgi:hypothetical protein
MILDVIITLFSVLQRMLRLIDYGLDYILSLLWFSSFYLGQLYSLLKVLSLLSGTCYDILYTL